MSNRKFLSLIKTINSYGQDISRTWGDITKDNAATVALKKINNINLIELLLKDRKYSEVLTLLYYLPICSNEVIKAVYTYHHRDYVDILTILSTEKMILLYEQYHIKVHEENKGLTSATDISFTNNYRKVISKKYVKSKSSQYANIDSSKYISTIINEYKFLTFEYFEDFFIFLSNIKNIDYVTNFTNLYYTYKKFTLIIDKLINEYYLQYIKYQYSNISNMYGNSFIILEPYYKNIIMCIKSLPIKHIDVNYQDIDKFTMLHYIAYLPVLEQNINTEMCSCLDKLILNFRTDLTDSDNNSVIHAALINDNFTMVDKFLMLNQDTINTLSNVYLVKNSKNKTVYDILIEKERYDYIAKIANDKLPDKVKNTIVDKILNKFETVQMLLNYKIYTEVYTILIDYYFNTAIQFKNDLLYDIIEYNRITGKIIQLVNYLDDKYIHICTEWLLKSVVIDQLDIFDTIVKKLFKNIDITQYFNTLPDSDSDTFMFICINMNRIKFVEYIAKFNPDLNMIGKSGYSPIIAALNSKNKDIISVLIKYLDDKNEASIVCKNVLHNYYELTNNKQSINTHIYNTVTSYFINIVDYFKFNKQY